MSRPVTTVPLRLGAQVLDVPADLLEGALIRMRLPRSPITQVIDGVTVVVGDSGTGWIEHTVRPVGSCAPDRELEPELWLNAQEEPDGSTSPHGVTVCPECIDSWACDWEIEVALTVEGSGGS